MNRTLIALSLMLSTLNCPAGADRDARTPVCHNLTVVLEPERHFVTVEDKIELPAEHRHAGAEFSLSAALTVSASEPAVTKLATDDDGTAKYALAAEPPEGIFRVSYAGTIDYGLSEQKEEYTRGFRESRGTLGPEGVYLHGETGWIPKFDDELIRFKADVKAPANWHVISQGNGTSRGEDGRAHWESGGLMEQAYLVGGPLHVERDSAGAVEALVYLHEPDAALARKYLEATTSYLAMYDKLIGPYPYGKFALVENFWETGYGMPSFTLLGPQVIRFPFILTSSYPHEILHNWWGNSVFVDYESGNWCEGLTAYLADHLIQEQRGQGSEYRRGVLQKYRNYVHEGRDFPLTEFRARHSAATEAVGYGKALMLYHMLRLHVGDDHFRAALADFYRRNQGRRATFDDVRAAFEAVAGEDLKPFFTQWIERPGAPELLLHDVAIGESPGGFTLLGMLSQRQSAEPFALEVPLYIRTVNGVESHIIRMNARSQLFKFELNALPITLAADPLFDVFRLLDSREIPPSIGQLFGEPRILAVLPKPSADEPAVDAYRTLVESWQSDEHQIEIVSETELKALPDDRSVWILGRHNRYAPIEPSSAASMLITDSGTQLTLAGESVPFAGHCTVVVRRHHRTSDKAVGWITVDSVAAFAGLGRKLPHYGKYSYLAFEGDEPTNVLKGQWKADESPLVYTFDPAALNQQGPRPPEEHKALAELPPAFSQKALMDHVQWLSAPERAGRGLGTPELTQAAEYIAERMKQVGLEPGGDNGTWFQRFTVAKGPDGKPTDTVNVIGVLRGTRAKWSDQSIVLGAHYDHLGRGWPDVHAGDEGKIHPGADDNGSGVAVMLELARNLAAAGGGSRNLAVIAFSAEESGRLGSQYYVEHPLFPREGIRGMINVDTVGRLFDGKIAIHGAATADEWQHIFRGCGFVTGIPNQIVPGGAEASDQESFIERGIPAVQIFTGAHADYHRPGDTADKIDGAGLVKVAAFLKEALSFLLEREAPLTVRIEGAAPPPAASQPAMPGQTGRRVSFGTVPDFAYTGPGVKVESTVPDSPAAHAGILGGDVLLRIDGREIADLRAFSEHLKTLSPGQEVEATILRDGAEINVKVVVQKR